MIGDKFNFEKLIVYQKGKEYVKFIYTLLRKFPPEENFGLCSQLRRASVSITSNIAEGMSRTSTKEKIHFLDISYGSLMETFSQIDIAYDLDYISEKDINEARSMVWTILKLLAGLKKSIQKDITKN